MEDLDNSKIKACSLAKAILTRNTDYLENVLALLKIGNKLHGQVWETEFHVFGVIASDTDHLPTNKVRELCSPKMLVNTDNELSEIISFYSKQVQNSCNEILDKYGNV